MVIGIKDVGNAVSEGINKTVGYAGDVIDVVKAIHGGVQDIKRFTDRMNQRMNQFNTQAEILSTSIQNIPNILSDISMNLGELDTLKLSMAHHADDVSADVQTWIDVLNRVRESYTLATEKLTEHGREIGTGELTNRFSSENLYQIPLKGVPSILGTFIPSQSTADLVMKYYWKDSDGDWNTDWTPSLFSATEGNGFEGYTQEEWGTKKANDDVSILGEIVADAPGRVAFPQYNEDTDTHFMQEDVYAIDIEDEASRGNFIVGNETFWAWYWTEKVQDGIADITQFREITTKLNSIRQNTEIASNLRSSIRGGVGPLGELLNPLSTVAGGISGYSDMFQSLFTNPQQIMNTMEDMDDRFIKAWDSFNAGGGFSIPEDEEIISTPQATYTVEETEKVPPPNPSDVTKDISGSSVTLTWDMTKDNYDRFIIEHQGPDMTTYEKEVEITQKTYTDDQLKYGEHRYRIIARNTYGDSDPTPIEAFISEGAVTNVPSAPTDLSTSDVTSSSITVGWNANPPEESVSYYNVYRSQSSTTGYQKVAERQTTYYDDTNLSSDTNYYYKISAVNSAGESSKSSYISETTSQAPSETAVPSKPANLSGQYNGTTGHNEIWWDANPSQEEVTHYNVYREGSQRAQVSVTSFDEAWSQTSISQTITYSVSAVNENGEGPKASIDIFVPAEGGATLTSGETTLESDTRESRGGILW